MNHTPLPWKVTNNKGHIEIVPDSPEWTCAIGKVYKSGKMNANRYSMPFEDNARLIVQACNSHAELLEALEAINSILSIWLVDPSKAPNTLVTSIRTVTEPAIRKARGE